MDVLSAVWQFFQEQVLGMSWLNQLVGQGLQALGLDLASRWGGSLHFFLYDVIKITILLCTLIFLISYVQSYFLRRSAAAVFWAVFTESGPICCLRCWGR